MSEFARIEESFIDGQWISTASSRILDLVDPVIEEEVGSLALGGAADVESAVSAARRAQADFGNTSREERLEMLVRILKCYSEAADQLAWDTCYDIGAPIEFSRKLQVVSGAANLRSTIEALRDFSFVRSIGHSEVERQSIGVCGLITPWNWPLNQITAKVAAALAAGCSMVLKPSEYAPRTARTFARVLEAAELPPGVFNMVFGDAEAGSALSGHPGIAAISFTGSTAAGIRVAQTAAPNVARVSQELGGKSPYIVADGETLADGVADCTRRCMANAGQSCNAPTRLLVPAGRIAEAESVAAETVAAIAVGNPRDTKTQMGPVVNRRQFEQIQEKIGIALQSGAKPIAGGTGRPEGIKRGFFVRPTVFSNVDNAAELAQEEVFGPVLAIVPYESRAQAVELANASRYGLAAYVVHDRPDAAREIASSLRSGMVHINFAGSDAAAPFGGFGHSGNGRERGVFGIEEFLEVKSIFGHKRL